MVRACTDRYGVFIMGRLAGGKLVGLLAAAVATVATAPKADAGLMMRVTSGASQVTITDGSAPDAVADNVVSYVGPLGGFSLVISSSVSNQPGSGNTGRLQLTTLDIRNGAPTSASLTVEVWDWGFTAPGPGAAELRSAYSGTETLTQNGDIFSYASFADPANTPLGTAVATPVQQYVTIGSTGARQFTTPDQLTPFTLTGPAYSMYSVMQITLSPNAQANTSSTTEVTVPEETPLSVPEAGTLGLLAVGVGGLLARRRR